MRPQRRRLRTETGSRPEPPLATASLEGSGHGGHRDGGRLGRVRDLAYDLDDVSVGVERPPLAVGAVAARQDFSDPFELALRAKLAGVRLDIAERASDEL